MDRAAVGVSWLETLAGFMSVLLVLVIYHFLVDSLRAGRSRPTTEMLACTGGCFCFADGEKQ